MKHKAIVDIYDCLTVRVLFRTPHLPLYIVMTLSAIFLRLSDDRITVARQFSHMTSKSKDSWLLNSSQSNAMTRWANVANNDNSLNDSKTNQKSSETFKPPAFECPQSAHQLSIAALPRGVPPSTYLQNLDNCRTVLPLACLEGSTKFIISSPSAL